MKDTIVVEIKSYKKEPKYKKFMLISKRYKAHDKGNTFKVGDTVDIVPSKPISKDKHFKVIQNLKVKDQI